MMFWKSSKSPHIMTTLIKFHGSNLSPFNALSPLDGRYAKQTAQLGDYFSESALMKYRIRVEAQWMLHLIRNNIITESSECSFQQVQSEVTKLWKNFNNISATRIKIIQSTINHDLKSVEYFIKENLTGYQQNVHVCCTSEDINNLAYALMLQEAMKNVIMPNLNAVHVRLANKSIQWASHTMLGRTHGQSATPTTLGKQFSIFAYRVKKQIKNLNNVRLSGKMNGAVGNYNAHYFAYPNIDWMKINEEFVEKVLNLEFNPYTTQIQSHDSIARVAGELQLCNTILIGLCRDSWEYIAKGYLTQVVKSSQVGSSTMPHKVNPIDFQNCEGNLGLANSVLQHFRSKLPISRMQRDLSDSTVLRNQGIAFGYSLVAYKSLLKGLDKVNSNREYMLNELKEHHEVITEAIQTELRKINYPEPYQLLKNISRGQPFTAETKQNLINKLEGSINEESLNKIKNLNPENYLGKAEQLANKVIEY